MEYKDKIKVKLLEYPTEQDWLAVKQRAFVTIGKYTEIPPSKEWKHKILEARHSPIRRLHFAFYIECPSWVSVHLCRHIHTQPYVKSQRNDRQTDYDRNAARQDEMICMIWDMNAESLMTVANKRLCRTVSEETQYVVKLMCDQVYEACPEFMGLLVPNCIYHGGVCHEMKSCKNKKETNQ